MENEKLRVRQEVESAISSQSLNYLEIDVDGTLYEIFIPKMQSMMTRQAKERFILRETAKILNTIFHAV